MLIRQEFMQDSAVSSCMRVYAFLSEKLKIESRHLWVSENKTVELGTEVFMSSFCQ